MPGKTPLVYVRKSRSWIALPLICLLLAPWQIMAQCPAVVGTTTAIMSTGIMFTIITKTLSMTAMCVTTSNNAFGCARSPTATMADMLIATNFNTVGPYCNWSCTCGVGPPPHYRIDVSDGLPVELLEFSVDDEEEEQENGDADETEDQGSPEAD